MLLADIIIEKIKKEGPVSFHDFMDMCLYYPDLGYYTAAPNTIGARGDFYTSANLTPVFGAMLARQLEEMWQLLGRQPFTIVEYGAGTGLLCHDILDYLVYNAPLFDGLSYYIIEKSPVMRGKEKAHLQGKVTWVDTIRDIPAITGCILSNELVDNFAVHQVVMQDALMEVYVDYQNEFVEVLQPAGTALTHYLAELNVQLPKGYRTEINLEATAWIGEIAACLKSGYVMTIDYGYPSSALYAERRNGGTLICYHKHQVNDEPYKHIGEQDITAHVNFSALCHWGIKNGLLCCGYTSQANFLLAHGFNDYLKKNLEQEPDVRQRVKKEALLIRTLLLDMGCKFNVLIQRKGNAPAILSGL